ncbi:MAG: hypothetical protein WAX89_04355 [Alphaproteobacteria bacterium]
MLENISAAVSSAMSSMFGKAKTFRQQVWESVNNTLLKLTVTALVAGGLVYLFRSNIWNITDLYEWLYAPARAGEAWLGIVTDRTVKAFYKEFMVGGTIGFVMQLLQLAISLFIIIPLMKLFSPTTQASLRMAHATWRTVGDLVLYWIPVAILVALAVKGHLPLAQGIINVISYPALWVVNYGVNPTSTLVRDLLEATAVGFTMNMLSMALLFMVRMLLLYAQRGQYAWYRTFRG